MYYCKHIPCVGLFIKQQLKPWYNWMKQNQKFWEKKRKKNRHIAHLKSRKRVHRKYCFKNLWVCTHTKQKIILVNFGECFFAFLYTNPQAAQRVLPSQELFVEKWEPRSSNAIQFIQTKQLIAKIRYINM